jgi:hypothetical protein
MRLSKLIVPAAVAAALAMFVSHAGAQTMGEYAATTASVGSGASSAGTSMGADTWGASSLGASFDERAGAASTSMQGSFAARASEMSGAAASESGSRWPTSQFAEQQDRFGKSSDRFGSDADRFPQRTELSGSDRFPASRFNDNSMGLDTHFASSSGLDTHYSTAGEDTSGTTSQP